MSDNEFDSLIAAEGGYSGFVLFKLLKQILSILLEIKGILEEKQ